MGEAYFDVSGELLCNLLNLPAGTTFRGAEAGRNDELRFYVEHPDLPETEGIGATRVTPVFRTVNQSVFEFEDWGLE